MKTTLIILTGFLLLSGCTSIDPVGVRGLPLRDGLSVGLREDYVYSRGHERDYTLFTDIGYTWMKTKRVRKFGGFRNEDGKPLAGEDFNFFDFIFRRKKKNPPREPEKVRQMQAYFKLNLSIPQHDDSLSEYGAEGGFRIGSVFSSVGYTHSYNDDTGFDRVHYSFYLPFSAITLSSYSPDADKRIEMDIHITLGEIIHPLIGKSFFSLGQRLTWFDGYKGSAVFLGGTFVPWQNIEAGSEKSFLIDLGVMIDNSRWYGRDRYEYLSRTGIRARYFF